MPALGPPDDPALPFFVYGLLKPGELAFPQVAPYIAATAEPAVISGTLWLRDGIPLLDPRAGGQVSGWLLRFDPANLDGAWETVTSFEPAEQYRWTVAAANTGKASVIVNVLEGRRLDRGTAAENVEEWSAWHDPVFGEGLDEVARLAQEAAPQGIDPRPDTLDLWQSFFRLQAAYLLLWSVVERYTVLRFGPRLEPGPRVSCLGRDDAFRAAVVAAAAGPGEVTDSRDPAKRRRITGDGEGAAEYFYRIRSNLSHRGKSAYQDAQLVHKAVTELHGIMLILLARQMPREDADTWLQQRTRLIRCGPGL